MHKTLHATRYTLHERGFTPLREDGTALRVAPARSQESEFEARSGFFRSTLKKSSDSVPSFRAGFSLIEILVSVAVFSMVMLIAVGSLLTLVEANRKAQALKSVMNNLNFSLENMSRAIRLGTDYHCGLGLVEEPHSCIDGDTQLAFESEVGDPGTPDDQVIYRISINGTQLEQSIDGGATFIGITAPEVVIEDFKFYVIGAERSDRLQPRVIMTIRGYAGVSLRAKSNFNLQTMVSQRILDVP